MEATWQIDDNHLLRWRELVDSNHSRPLPRSRRARNVKRQGISLTKDAIWHAIVGCQVTTQQRSGPKSAVSRFLHSGSDLLSFRRCRQSASLKDLAAIECTNAGLRRAPTIAKNLDRIFSLLEAGEWKALRAQLDTLVTNTTQKKERAVVSYLLRGKKYPGLGQKQARNFIQWLGLSRYEVPLDSRVLKKLREFGSSFVPSSAALTDEAVYSYIQEGLQSIAKHLGIYPCELDACIFASFDMSDDADGDDEAW